MKVIWQTPVIVLLMLLVVTIGCVPKSQYDTCKRQNAIVNERLEELLANQENQRLGDEQWEQKNQFLIKMQLADKQKIKALQTALAAKQALIEQLTEQIGQVALPVELSNALADWARQSGSDLVSFDEKTGVVRLKSDLVFDSGYATVKPDAKKQIQTLSEILNSSAAQGFDILIVGHTDDQPIKQSVARHPTNWHLSAHRAIAVEAVLAEAGMDQARMAVMGMGEFRPIEPNNPGNKGNSKNRRVELYIVPAGQISFTGSVNAAG